MPTLQDAIESEIETRVEARLNEKLDIFRKALKGLEGVLSGKEVASLTRSVSPTPPVQTRARKNGSQACSVIGCKRPRRAKGFCATHYQKFKNLQAKNRLPPDWKEDAPPRSIKDVKLTRGRKPANQEGAVRAATTTF